MVFKRRESDDLRGANEKNGDCRSMVTNWSIQEDRLSVRKSSDVGSSSILAMNFRFNLYSLLSLMRFNFPFDESTTPIGLP